MRKNNPKPPLCACGCGQPTKTTRNGSYNDFLLGHNPKRTSKPNAAKTGKFNRKRGQFMPGQSGNPSGRPAGSHNNVTIAALNMIGGEAEALSRQAIEQALGGNAMMLKFCLERLTPVCKDSPVKIGIDAPKTIDDVVEITSTLLDKVNKGEITPSQSDVIGKTVDRHLKALQMRELEERLEAIERKLD